MSAPTAAIIGAGSQGWVHASAYRAVGVEVTAVVDTNPASAERLAATCEGVAVGADASGILASVQPDIVSICTPPASHPTALAAAISSDARAVHCEKPLALSPSEARAMVHAADRAGVQLTVNLQRRFDPVQRFAHQQILAGTVGDVVTVEGYCPNLGDWGAHIIDLVLFHLEDRVPEWVLGQIDVSTNRTVYGAVAETLSVSRITWADGVAATIATGREPAASVLHLQNQLGILVQGTEGRIDIRGDRCVVRRFGKSDLLFESPFDTDAAHWERGVDPAIVAATTEAVRDLLGALKQGREPALAARHALLGSEIVFATYESSRSRRRVPVPTDVDDNALVSGLEAGLWHPEGELHGTW